MDAEHARLMSSTVNMATIEARDRLQSIMTSDMAEALEQIRQTLEACGAKKTRLLTQLDDVARAVDIVRNECGCIDTTIASKVLHLNSLATQIIQQMALVQIPDPAPPPPPPEPIPPPTVEIDLSSVHDRLNALDHMVNDMNKLLREKEETMLYVINRRPGNGEMTTSVHSPMRVGARRRSRHKHFSSQMSELQSMVQSLQSETRTHSREISHQRAPLAHHRAGAWSRELSLLDEEEASSQINGHGNSHTTQDDDDEDEEDTSRDSEKTAVGPCTTCLEERTDDTGAKRMSSRRSMTNSNYTDRSQSYNTTSVSGGATSPRRGLGEALASNGTDIIYYDFERGLLCTKGGSRNSVEFHHGLVVDLHWWAAEQQWLILSERGLYTWRTSESSCHERYHFSPGEIGFRRIAVTSTSVFCLYRYSFMVLELSNTLEMKRLHALAPPDNQYPKLSDIGVRTATHEDGHIEEVLGLVWFGNEPGVIVQERHETLDVKNTRESLHRLVTVQQGRFARIAPYDDGQSWLLSNTGTNVFWIVHNTSDVNGQWEGNTTWVAMESGTPINAVASHDSAVCIRLQTGVLEFLTPGQ